ncbi:MAG: hypothetical protein ACREP2_12145, partial [Rhodanobacteraceae bacterium]
ADADAGGGAGGAGDAGGDAKPFDPVATARKMSAQDLIDSLVDEDDAFRKACRAELIRRGKAIIPDLRRNMYNHDPDVREWVLNIYREISATTAWNKDLRQALATTKVTIDLKNVFLPDAIKQLAQVSGLDISLSPHLAAVLPDLKDADREKLTISLSAANDPAEKVLNELLSATGLDASLVFDGVVIEAGDSMRYAVVEQALRTRIKPITLTKVPIDKVLAYLRKKSPVDIVMDPKAVEQMAGKNWTVTLDMNRDLSLKSALALTLDGWDLQTTFDETRLIVTTRDANITQDRHETIDIHELVELMAENRDDNLDETNLAAEVIAAIKACVQRRSWEREGVQISAARGQEGMQLEVMQREGTILAVKDFVSILKLAEQHQKEARAAAAEAKRHPVTAPAPQPAPDATHGDPAPGP